MLDFRTCLFITPEKYKTPYENNKLKIIAPTWNDEFELPDGSCSASDIQDYIKYIIKKHEKLPTNPPIQACNEKFFRAGNVL